MELMENKNSVYKNSLKFIVVVFGGVSATTMILFCVSLTENTTGQILAGATGLGMIVAQYAFVYMVQDSEKFNAIGWLIVICLFTASVAGTYSWIESEFKTGTAKNTQQSDSYKDYSDLIAMKKATIQENIEQAKSDRTNQKGNYNGRAINTTGEAEKGQQELKKLIDERRKLKGNGAVKSSQALAADFGEYRWIAWLFWALIVDICPLYAIHQLSNAVSGIEGDTFKDSDTQIQAGTFINSKECEGDTALKQGRKAESDACTVEGATTQILSQAKQYNRIVQAITRGQVKPGKNAVRVHFGLGTATVDKIFNQLIENEVIRRSQNNRTYELVKSELVEK